MQPIFRRIITPKGELKRPAVRPWYAGKSPPAGDLLDKLEAVDEETKVLYDPTRESEGEFAEIMRGLYDKMDSLKRSPDEFRTWTEEDGYQTFYETLTDLAPQETRVRVQLLQQLGAFKFRSGAAPDEKKSLIAAVFAEPEEDEAPNAVSGVRSGRLSRIWSPPQDSLLDYILARPAQAGRVLSDRLNPTNQTPFRLIGHPFEEVRSTHLEPIKEAKLVAFERESEIHLVMAVKKTLQDWDQDATASGGVEQISLIEALLMHELVELVIDETEPDLDPLCSHIIASTFERYLKGTFLNFAVEDFFFAWPPLSSNELEEREAREMEQELEEASALLTEEEAPDDLDEDLDDLPLDDVVPVRKKKKKKKKKKRE